MCGLGLIYARHGWFFVSIWVAALLFCWLGCTSCLLSQEVWCMEGLHWVCGEGEGVLMSRWRWLSHVEGGWSCICSLRCCSAQPAAGAGLAAARGDLPLPVAASPARASLTAGLYCVRAAG